MRGVLDRDYQKGGDTGEKHVFEVWFEGGIVVHHHAHENGTVQDQPYRCPAASTGDVGITETVLFRKGNCDVIAYEIGQREATQALNTILALRPGENYIDITDGIGFDWRRFLLSHPGLRQLAGLQITNAAVLRSWKGIYCIPPTPGIALYVSKGGGADVTYLVNPDTLGHTKAWYFAEYFNFWEKLSARPTSSWLS